MSFIVIPAIDLKDGKCVRLRQGKAEEVTTYSEDPVAMARHWEKEGAQFLHVVDLDGAFQGRPVHTEVISRITEAIRVPVEVGGGLRTDEDIERTLTAGVRRVIVGTRALSEPADLERLVTLFGERLAVGIDARYGRVQIKGWTETTGEAATVLAMRASEMGVKCIVYTDTSRDGMMAGVNATAVDVMCGAVSCSVIASGGVTSAEDVKALRGLGRKNLAGVIVGKALYEGRVKLKDLE